MALAAGITASPSGAAPASTLCGSGFVDAVIGGAPKCLRGGEFCSARYASDYQRYGFACVGGHLTTGGASPPPTTPTTTTVPFTQPTYATMGASIALLARSRTAGCKLGTLPDRRCSPGAYAAGLSTAVICADEFRTDAVRHVTDTQKHAVEVEYGMKPRSYGATLEIDHIISLELGGSNDAANLFPEKAPGYRAKDKLENRLHDLVCAGEIALRSAQQRIASDWVQLYRDVFGAPPLTR